MRTIIHLCVAFAMLAATPALAKPPAVTFKLESAWTDGFTASILIDNPSDAAPISGWTLRFDWATTPTGFWNANLVSSGTTRTFTNLDWNAAIAPGARVTVGYQGSGTFTPSVTNCTLNGVAATVSYLTPGGTTASFVRVAGVGDTDLSMSVPQGTSTFALSLASGATATGWSAVSNRPEVCSVSIVSGGLRMSCGKAGLASLRLRETGSGSERLIGVAVREATGALPGLPPHVALGSVSENAQNQLDFWKGSGTDTTRMDVRYIYINGGPQYGWRTWTTVPGDRARTYIRDSKRLGMIPCFVFYNVPDGGESYTLDSEHLGSASYMASYYQDLALFLKICREETADGWPVMIIYEPDLLGYMAQNAIGADQASWAASGGPVQVQAAYTTNDYDGKAILRTGTDPAFPASLRGFVQSVNYLTKRELPAAQFGWQFNLWASPANGWTTPIGSKGLMHLVDAGDVATQRAKVRAEAAAITRFYAACGVNTCGATLVSVDKYGLDAAAETGAASNPAASTWFWNADNWNAYLEFVAAMRDGTGLPVVLWQIPVGHTNTSSVAGFAALDNTQKRYEDSAPTFLLGDAFSPGTAARQSWFERNRFNDPLVTSAPGTCTWGSHMAAARDAGVRMVLFGAGVGISTNAVPTAGTTETVGTDGGWWMRAAQAYLANPVPLVQATCPGDLDGSRSVDNGDLALLLLDIGGNGVDLDGNGATDLGDVATLLLLWGPCT